MATGQVSVPFRGYVVVMSSRSTQLLPSGVSVPFRGYVVVMDKGQY